MAEHSVLTPYSCERPVLCPPDEDEDSGKHSQWVEMLEMSLWDLQVKAGLQD